MNTFEEVVEAKGHLIDSGIMSQILDRVIEHKCTFEIEKFLVGKTNDDYSLARIKIQSHSSESLKELLDILVPLGCYLAEEQDARIEPALGSGRVPMIFTPLRTTGLTCAFPAIGNWCRNSAWTP